MSGHKQMNRMMTFAALSALMLANPLMAQMAPPTVLAKPTDDTPETLNLKREAASKLLALMSPVWTEDQIGRIMYIGWYSGAAAMCDDLEIDQSKLSAALQSLMPPGDPKLTPEKAQFLQGNLLMHVGIATGWVMAGHYRDVPKFCAEARQTKAEMPREKQLFVTSDDTLTKPK